mmetsp:Transcript_37472/g.111521  ORF Transcript_37472/g.111521 Transcript_37472/m.111521 type:complete len:362 (+) Transcript_37472:1050-2135(+)
MRGGSAARRRGIGVVQPRATVRRELERNSLGERRQRGGRVVAPAPLYVASKHQSSEGERVGVGRIAALAVVREDEDRVAREQRQHLEGVPADHRLDDVSQRQVLQTVPPVPAIGVHLELPLVERQLRGDGESRAVRRNLIQVCNHVRHVVAPAEEEVVLRTVSPNQPVAARCVLLLRVVLLFLARLGAARGGGGGAGAEWSHPRAVRVVVLGNHNHLIVVVDQLIGAGDEDDAAVALAQADGYSALKRILEEDGVEGAANQIGPGAEVELVALKTEERLEHRRECWLAGAIDHHAADGVVRNDALNRVPRDEPHVLHVVHVAHLGDNMAGELGKGGEGDDGAHHFGVRLVRRDIEVGEDDD